MNTFYDILEVSPHASTETIKAAYKSLVQRYHPDKNSAPDAEDRIKRINAAYRVLSQPHLRRAYDEHLESLFKKNAEQATQEKRDVNSGAAAPPEKPQTNQREKKHIFIFRRFCARLLDYMFLGFVLRFVFSGLAAVGLITQAGVLLLQNQLISGMVVILIWIPIEAIFLSTIGSTPGKLLFGVKIHSQVEPAHFFLRPFLVSLEGLCLGLPFISNVFMIYSAVRLWVSGQVPWDRQCRTFIKCDRLSHGRWLANSLLLIGITAGALALKEGHFIPISGGSEPFGAYAEKRGRQNFQSAEESAINSVQNGDSGGERHNTSAKTSPYEDMNNLYNQGRPEELFAYALNVLQLYPNDTLTLNYCALALSSLNRHYDAQEFYERAISSIQAAAEPMSIENLRMLAMILQNSAETYVSSGNIISAQNRFRQALSIMPNDTRIKSRVEQLAPFESRILYHQRAREQGQTEKYWDFDKGKYVTKDTQYLREQDACEIKPVMTSEEIRLCRKKFDR